ncbi:PREDICTED: uncharacterized protein LOC105953794 isoform X2 [Erythranthe guttata]|uniref:uncharacterized protein LOC105953794 isoform X2 n=1 Tax=Erythranthe guttata TaxID=4155 RepID=UPI00064DBF07|nr:PREDICTED: uncharacterized protein LOC105953794 isoform X2 [Erythranthe guttata]|eukprot:XP_012832928.1 PREDICTED: uncharacterized protein LOC105953794 isoform X2 [Erythranthe guttata]
MAQNKKLNLNQPILSVRRQNYSQNNYDETKTDKAVSVIRPRLPLHRPEPKSGPVKNPGTVPFHWEQTPGKPKPQCENFEISEKSKDESKSSSDNSSGYCDESFVFVDAISRTRTKDASGRFSSDRKKKTTAFRGVVNNRDELEGGDFLRDCGLVPRFCFKSSICVLNPIPAMSIRARAIFSSCSNGIQSSASSSTHHSENEYEVKPVGDFRRNNKARSKNEIAVIYCGKYSLSFLEEKKDLYVKGFESQKKGSKTFEELLQADRDSQKEFDLLVGGNSIVEKTVYVDSEYKVDNNNNILDSIEEEEEEDNEISTKRMDPMHAAYSSRKDFKKSNTLDGEFDERTRESRCIKKVYSTDKSNTKWGTEITPMVFGENKGANVDSTTTRKNIKVAENEATNNIGKYSDFPVPPPLLKSPSDSWLGRTLPSMSTRNGSFKARRGDIKSENVLKSTQVKRHNLRYSEVCFFFFFLICCFQLSKCFH